MAPYEDRLPTVRSDVRMPEVSTTTPPQRSTGNQLSGSNGSVGSDSSNTDESEESYLDSLEEGRAPLLGDGDDEDAEFERPRHRTRRGPNGLYGEDRTDGGQTHRFPKEKRKTGLALLLLFFAGCSNDFVLSFIHDFVPDTPPLPDVVFANTPYCPWALRISEYLMLASFAVMLVVTFLHKHRWIVLRRIATIGALLYLGRCVTMYVTQVPKADVNYYCSAKLNPATRTLGEVFLRALRILTSVGLAINGNENISLCGDYIYSGHTIVLVTSYLFIREYSPRHWRVLHVISAVASTVGVSCLLISRGHYTVDVVIAYWITTRVFWQYHTLASFAVLREGRQENNHLRKVIWYPLFKFMESNVLKPLPHNYGLPFSWKHLGRLRLFKRNDH